jgi:hypothetical protein
MNRISTNESFPRNIILSIDPKEENYQSNLKAFKKFFNTALDYRATPEVAVEIAIEKLEKFVKRNSEVFVEKSYLKPPKNPRPKVEKTPGEKREKSVVTEKEGLRFRKLEREKTKETIMKKLSDGTGAVGDELINLYKTFIQKRKNYTDSMAISRTIQQYNNKKTPKEEKKVYTEEEIERFIPLVADLDRTRPDRNILIYKRHIQRGFSPQQALDRVKTLMSARKYMDENGIEITPAHSKMFLESDGDFDSVARQIREREEEGRLGLDVNKLYRRENEKEFVIYNGERIGLSRLVQFLYNDLPLRNKKFIFERLQDYIYDYGMSTDDAIAKVNKAVIFYKTKPTLTTMFPEDPNIAITIFEEHYLDDDMSFEDAMEATKNEIYPSN